MQTEHFKVNNVKCGGCVANIKQGLVDLPGISSVEVSIDSAEVSVTGTGLSRKLIAEKLSGLGYPAA